MEQLAVGTSSDLVNGLDIVRYGSLSHQLGWATHRRVKIDEDGARDVFAVAGFGEEGFERTALANLIGDLWIKTTIGLEAVLEQVPGKDRRLVHELLVGDSSFTKSGENIQFPGAVTQLGTSLADVKMADLEESTSQTALPPLHWQSK